MFSCTSKSTCKDVFPPISKKKFLLIIIAVHLDSAFTHGYCISCVQSIEIPLKEWLSSLNYKIHTSYGNNSNLIVSPTMYNYLDGSFYFGGIFGSLFVILFANKFGRKGGLNMASFISIFASIFCGYSKYFNSAMVLMLGRFLFGVKSALSSALAPMYMTEIAPLGYRGHYGVMYGIINGFGAVCSLFVAEVVGNKQHWPLALSICVVPAMLQLIILPSLPESPKYLLAMKGKELQCRKTLKWLRGDKYEENELLTIRKEYIQNQVLGKITLKDILDNLILRQALLSTTVILMSQQMCGITMALQYISHYLDKNLCKYCFMSGLILYGTLPIAGIFSYLIVTQASRRKHYLICFITMAISCLLQAFLITMPSFNLQSTFVYITSFVFMAAYKIGPGALAWFYPSEMFSTAAAPIAYSIGLTLNWMLAFLMLIFFKSFSQYLGGYGFLNYVISNGFLAYYTYYRVPNTSVESLKSVYNEIHDKHKRSLRKKSLKS